MSNVTPDFMEMLSKAMSLNGSFSLGRIVLSPRGLAWAAEFLRTFLTSIQPGPTVLAATSPLALPIMAAATPRLNESWVDVPDQVLGVKKLVWIRVTDGGVRLEGPDVSPHDHAVIVEPVFGGVGAVGIAVDALREKGAHPIAVFSLVDLQMEGEREQLTEGDTGLKAFFPVTNAKAIRDWRDRQAMK